MSDDFDINKLDVWYLNSHPVPKKSQSQVNNRVFALYVCKECDHTWEISTSGSIIRYKHLPKYGKQPKTCNHCKSGNNKTYKERQENKNDKKTNKK